MSNIHLIVLIYLTILVFTVAGAASATRGAITVGVIVTFAMVVSNVPFKEVIGKELEA